VFLPFPSNRREHSFGFVTFDSGKGRCCWVWQSWLLTHTTEGYSFIQRVCGADCVASPPPPSVREAVPTPSRSSTFLLKHFQYRVCRFHFPMFLACNLCAGSRCPPLAASTSDRITFLLCKDHLLFFPPARDGVPSQTPESSQSPATTQLRSPVSFSWVLSPALLVVSKYHFP